MTPTEAAEKMREDAAMACVGLRARAEIAATKARLAAEPWAPPEDRKLGYRCLGLAGGKWEIIEWGGDGWLGHEGREVYPDAFAPLPPEPKP